MHLQRLVAAGDLGQHPAQPLVLVVHARKLRLHGRKLKEGKGTKSSHQPSTVRSELNPLYMLHGRSAVHR
jgi:hypothetical protein